MYVRRDGWWWGILPPANSKTTEGFDAKFDKRKEDHKAHIQNFLKIGEFEGTL